MATGGPPTINIAEPSVRSILLVARAQGVELATATGFVAEHGGRNYLVTNWHVVAGRRPDDGVALATSGAVPDELVVIHNVAGQLGSWLGVQEPLYDRDGDPLWLEHPRYGRRVDVVGLPVTQTQDVALYPYVPGLPGIPIAMGPSDPLSIIGFPFGRTAGGMIGVWVQGTLASEPAIDWQDLPCFLVDSRTRSGQSGSPAILWRTGAYTTEAGSTVVSTGIAERFVGIYSGRINEHSDLGVVWKTAALVELLNGQRHGPLAVVGPPP